MASRDFGVIGVIFHVANKLFMAWGIDDLSVFFGGAVIVGFGVVGDDGSIAGGLWWDAFGTQMVFYVFYTFSIFLIVGT
ncbi:hypothetical protein KWH75_17375 [Morganella morganii]|uniref:hypothetical protein n=1 Tax=Morganella morganii TaxID=582 RepID=UPI0021CE4469|nr:hypothetical protein [Morganella morganii]MCU6238837.1 hypothetical protein [Morganella morganii]